MPNAKKAGGKKQARSKDPEPHWKDEPEEHDFPAALSFLSLLLDQRRASAVVKAFRTGPVAHYKAKDLLRASNLPLLPEDNTHVALDLDKVRQRQKLSPVLLVRGSLDPSRPLVVADGYHRICASWHLDENADIPCRLVDLPANAARVRASAPRRAVSSES